MDSDDEPIGYTLKVKAVQLGAENEPAGAGSAAAGSKKVTPADDSAEALATDGLRPQPGLD